MHVSHAKRFIVYRRPNFPMNFSVGAKYEVLQSRNSSNTVCIVLLFQTKWKKKKKINSPNSTKRLRKIPFCRTKSALPFREIERILINNYHKQYVYSARAKAARFPLKRGGSLSAIRGKLHTGPQWTFRTTFCRRER